MTETEADRLNDEIDRETADFIAYLHEIDSLQGYQRHRALIEFARSDCFLAAGLLMIETPGRIHREAYKALRDELDAETPARAWDAAYAVADRAVICRYLKIDISDPAAFFATFPFRILRPEGERPWIAGAIGCMRLWDADRIKVWRHIDITDVILWNPRTNEVRLAGDAGATVVHGADYQDGRYTVFGDGFAFFRAWADLRAALWGCRQAALQSKERIIPREPVDSGLPGALVIGDLDAIAWREMDASVLVAGPGTDAAALKRAVFRSARLPRIEDQRRAA